MQSIQTLTKTGQLHQLWKVDNNGCWIWQRQINKGYGRVTIAGRNIGAHSLIYILYKGIYDRTKFEIDHLCGVRACVNPEHLEIVTHAENMRRMLLKRGFKADNKTSNSESSSKDRQKRIKSIAEAVILEVEAGRSIEEIQKSYALPKRKIEKILRKKQWV